MKVILKFLLVVLVLNSCGTPGKYKKLCERYKIYRDSKTRSTIYKFRDRIGGYQIYENGGSYYCRAEITPRGDFLYYFGPYPTEERALEAEELGIEPQWIIDYDDNLDILYMGQVGKFKIKERCTTICE